METASIQPSRDDDVARVPASIFVFPPDRFSYRFRRPFEDGGHVDACVELSGSRWLYVSTSTALAGIRRLVAGVLANMDSAFGRL